MVLKYIFLSSVKRFKINKQKNLKHFVLPKYLESNSDEKGFKKSNLVGQDTTNNKGLDFINIIKFDYISNQQQKMNNKCYKNIANFKV